MVEQWMIVTRPSEVIILCNINNNSYCIQHCINVCLNRSMIKRWIIVTRPSKISLIYITNGNRQLIIVPIEYITLY